MTHPAPDEFERRLIDLEMRMTAGGGGLPNWCRNALRAAAAIGAEIEREDCASRGCMWCRARSTR